MLAFILFAPAMLFAADFIYRPVIMTPPEPPREFRGAWITEIASTPDWPSKPGLSTAEQKAELIALLDRAVQLKLNAVILQIRPTCDAIYSSPIEPWSEYFTGAQGRPPEPFYDPLAFAIEEAHKRGLELHAWFNPFRASLAQAKSPAAPNHISRTHPELVRKYGAQLWLDPGEPAAREYVLRVVMDVVKRYDVDGVAFDDQLLYPYQEKDATGHVLNFPDDASWQKYGLRSGLSRNDWRRANGDEFIRSVYQSIKAVKPWVKFGISPFGIWRPGFPQQIKGLDADNSLYADSRLWLANGWLDYFAPQLYWPVDAPQQSFLVLLNWWSSQNVKGRNLWPGLDAVNVGEKWKPEEIARQIQITRGQNVNGEIFYHLRNLAENSALAGVIRNAYPQTALVPASPWLDSFPPEQPKIIVAENTRTNLQVCWENSSGEPAWLWVLQFRGTNNFWTTEILPSNRNICDFGNARPDIISISAVDRVGNLSQSAALKKSLPVGSGKGMILN